MRRCTLQSSSYQTPPKDNRNPLGDNLTFLRRQESRGGDCRAPVVSCVEVRSHVCTVPKSPRNLSHLSRVSDSFGFFEVMAHNSTRRNKPAKRDAWGLLRRGRSDILFDRKHQQERFDGTAPKGQHKTNKASATLGACPSTQPGRSKSVRHRYIRKMEEHLLKGGRDIPDRRRRRRRLLLGSNESSPNKVYERTLPMSDGPLAPADAIASSTHFCVVASSASCNEKQSETKNGDEVLIAKTAHRYGGTHAEKKNKTIDLSRGRGSTVRTRWLHPTGFAPRAHTHKKGPPVHTCPIVHTYIRPPAEPIQAHLGEHGVDELLRLGLLLHQILPLPLPVHVDRLLLLLRHLSEDRDALLVGQGVPRSSLRTSNRQRYSGRGGPNTGRTLRCRTQPLRSTSMYVCTPYMERVIYSY